MYCVSLVFLVHFGCRARGVGGGVGLGQRMSPASGPPRDDDGRGGECWWEWWRGGGGGGGERDARVDASPPRLLEEKRTRHSCATRARENARAAGARGGVAAGQTGRHPRGYARARVRVAGWPPVHYPTLAHWRRRVGRRSAGWGIGDGGNLAGCRCLGVGTPAARRRAPASTAVGNGGGCHPHPHTPAAVTSTSPAAAHRPPPTAAAATAPTATAAVPITTAVEQCGAASPSADPHALARQVAAQGDPSGRRSAATVSAPPTPGHRPPRTRDNAPSWGASLVGEVRQPPIPKQSPPQPLARLPARPPTRYAGGGGGVRGGVDREKTTARWRFFLHVSAPILFQ